MFYLKKDSFNDFKNLPNNRRFEFDTRKSEDGFFNSSLLHLSQIFNSLKKILNLF